MYAASFQGIYPVAPADQRYHFYPNQNPYWQHSTMYQGPFGQQPNIYPKHTNFGHLHPSMNHGYGYSSHHQLGGQNRYFDGYDTHQVQHVKTNQATKKHHKAQSPIKHHEYHWNHGYPFGQGSGLFPDYYNSNY